MIRLAEKKDIDTISKLLEEVLLVHHNIRPDLFKEKGQKYSNNELLNLLNKNDYKIFVYEENDIVMGHIFISIIEHSESLISYYNKEIYIDDLCVSREYQGKGIGRILFEYVKEYSKKINANYITLHVYDGNSANDFYEHLGFKERYKSLEIKL